MSDRTQVLAEFRAEHPTARVYEEKRYREMAPEEYETWVASSVDQIVANRNSAAADATDLGAVRAVLLRLRNNTATNDDRNRAILYLARRILGE